MINNGIIIYYHTIKQSISIQNIGLGFLTKTKPEDLEFGQLMRYAYMQQREIENYG